jgi:hypothetical protein
MKRAMALSMGVVTLVVGACSGGDASIPTAPRVADTVALGVLPEPPTPRAPAYVPPTLAPPTTAPIESMEPIAGPVGEVALGNRLLLVGDSAMLTLTPRHDGVACPALVDLGWQVDVEAERARYIDFGRRVIDELVIDAGDDWDVVGLMFGHDLDITPDEFGVVLDGLLDDLGPIPVLLYTVAERDDASAELNGVIRARNRPNVVIVDWGAAVADEQVLELVDDDFLPTDDGMERLVLLTAGALGQPATGEDGDCLEPTFTDDSAIVI